MTDPNVFGPLVTRNDVERAILDTLKLWMPAWLAEINRRHPSVPDLPAPRSWQMVDELDSEPAGLTPTVIVAFREGVPSRGNGGQVDATFDGGIAVFTEAGAPVPGLTISSMEQSRWLAGTYLGVIMAILYQYPDLGGLVRSTVPTAFSANDVGPGQENTQYAAGRVRATVTVDSILDAYAGPADPSVDPPADPVAVETVEIDVTPVATGDDLP